MSSPGLFPRRCHHSLVRRPEFRRSRRSIRLTAHETCLHFFDDISIPGFNAFLVARRAHLHDEDYLASQVTPFSAQFDAPALMYIRTC